MALVDHIIGVESGGNPYARNSNSSAAGLGQFIDSTWLEMLSRYRPDLASGRSRADLIALKTDPDISREMTAAYARQNASVLQGASLPVTPGSTYLAHFAGPQGAVNVLSADPSAPVGSILRSDAMKANPFLANMTAGDLIAWADKKMGGAPAPALAVPPNQLDTLPATELQPPNSVVPTNQPLNIIPPGAMSAQDLDKNKQMQALNDYLAQIATEQTQMVAMPQIKRFNLAEIYGAMKPRQMMPRRYNLRG